MARVDDTAPGDHSTFALIDLEAEIFLAREQEVTHVETGLKADDIACKQSFEDRVAHFLGQHLPVLRRRPGHVEEELDDGALHLLPDEARHEVELIVVNEN